MKPASYDVAIIGGALTGSSTAYHLLERDASLRVCVIERDLSYEWAASSRSNAGVRILFSQEENLRMSQYGHEFYRSIPERLQVRGERPVLDIYRHGYLFIANDVEQARDMEANHEFQLAMACDVRLLDAAAVKARFPSMECGDIVCAAFSPDDCWIDPHGALTGLRRKARDLGASYVEGNVAAIDSDRAGVRAVLLESGERIEATWVVNAAGAWAPRVCDFVGLRIPVEPLPRMVFYFDCARSLEQFPFTRDGVGVGFRPQGSGFISGVTNFEVAGQFCFDVRHEYFEEIVWPRLAHRVPAFETIKVLNAWAGHYAQNTFDGNMIIGAWPGYPENFLIATGYSGHGLQHTPAVGRALSELIVDGRFQAIDLARLSCRRIVDDRPYPERGVKA